jgi:hypothetical protein
MMESEAETGLRRLRRLERVLMNVEAEGKALYMDAWISDLAVLRDRGIPYTGSGERTCGTACCAGGYAALDPELMAEGLYLGSQLAEDDTEIWVNSYEQFVALPRNGKRALSCYVRFGDDYGYGALAEFFSIPQRESVRIFAPHSYTPIPARVIRIQDVLERARHVMMMAEAFTGDGRKLPEAIV